MTEECMQTKKRAGCRKKRTRTEFFVEVLIASKLQQDQETLC